MFKWFRGLFPANKAGHKVARSRRIRNKATHDDEKGLAESFVRRVESGDGSSIASIDFDSLDNDSLGQMPQLFSEHSGMSVFEGQVDHGYALQEVGESDKCPRCQAEMVQQYGHFIYASQPTPRIMLAPAGYFCTNCPTVIVDEHMLSKGVVGNYPFNGTVGMSPNGEDFVPFRTWNGQEPFHVFDETGNLLGLAAVSGATPRRRPRNKPPRSKVKRSQRSQKPKKSQRKKKGKRK